MCQFKMIIESKSGNKQFKRKGKIRANNIEEAINNIDIAFRCFNYTIVNIKQLN